ncbi:uncharacterized protein NFIA_090640 [Aspergillus fischeri NRRL 181]|uniref:Uncharacterized protein n=1 Tax=Neosartorya fischeri (strain ATCC 1020 / DSM 3700 / CBS 544.65 / FGSC A1164 / JCM 1740 / NRRL 181 / WB 181) TaxID=331117 RepID=A1DI99_NEOFI|nr:uncharacterized protein NFIA_090640 [Aspergillus fischeri NRRL 181]EAW19106.1 hypothetical protein NFIA_090640 [Aspergillus fischeri NRRL 181]KAG2021492.1 hypothetical protein GB937_004831 [Aspergillus fischeri]
MCYVIDLLLLAGAVAYALRSPGRAKLEETGHLHAPQEEDDDVSETRSDQDDEACDNIEPRSLEDWLAPVPDAAWHQQIRKMRQDKTGEALLGSAKF